MATSLILSRQNIVAFAQCCTSPDVTAVRRDVERQLSAFDRQLATSPLATNTLGMDSAVREYEDEVNSEGAMRLEDVHGMSSFISPLLPIKCT